MYIGPDRRKDRRNKKMNSRAEARLRNFGLDERVQVERRKEKTSWLLTSEFVNTKTGSSSSFQI